MYIVWNNINPTSEEVFIWGYDDEILLTEQDEDLILAAQRYVEVLFELATDANCPKSDYCSDILNNLAKGSLLSYDTETVRHIDSVTKQNSLISTGDGWLSDFYFCTSLMHFPRVIDLAESDKIAEYLLSCCGDTIPVTRLGKTSAHLVEYVKMETYRTYLYIDLSTGRWQHRKFRNPEH